MQTTALFLSPLFILALHTFAQAPINKLPSAFTSAGSEAKPLTPAQAAALVGGPTLITLHASAMPVAQVFDAVIKQATLMPMDTAHMGIVPGQTMTLDLDRVPFWKATSTLASQSHIGFAEMGAQSDQTTLQPCFGARDPLAGRVCKAGPFLVIIGSAQRNSTGSVFYTQSGATATPTSQYLTVSLSLLVDPKIHIIPGTTSLTILEATDETGATLVGSVPAESDINTNALYVLGGGVSLSAQGSSRRISRLRGVLHVTMITKAATWEVSNVIGAAGVAKTLVTAGGTAQLSVASVQPQDRFYRVNLTYHGPTFGLAFRPASALVFGSMRLTDSQGTNEPGFPGSVQESQADPGGAQNYTADMSFPVHGQGALTPPLKLTWVLPTSLATVDIPFEFTDLPLP